MFARWASFTGLLSLALGSAWLLHVLDEAEDGSPEDARYQPDHTMENFIATTMDENGLIKRRLQAQKMVHYPVADTELTKPYVVFYSEGQAGWHVSAEQGRVSPDGNTVHLLGHTDVWRDSPGQGRIEISARDVLVKLDEQYAETQAPAQLRTPNGEARSTGMKLFMQTRKMELLSQVKGLYENP
ncbi:MAG: LPS export ABC transporter periplasmic protein LptC [Gammaproteobacteria bacterium]|nr:LPS export ABC transporter periplasmic protein LptC [Gammaproteobacteria bacterium]